MQRFFSRLLIIRYANDKNVNGKHFDAFENDSTGSELANGPDDFRTL